MEVEAVQTKAAIRWQQEERWRFRSLIESSEKGHRAEQGGRQSPSYKYQRK
jgi:hypothetical protein